MSREATILWLMKNMVTMLNFSPTHSQSHFSKDSNSMDDNIKAIRSKSYLTYEEVVKEKLKTVSAFK
jgi:hypothetical protein